MKYIITLVLTIFLTGNFTPAQQLIAEKYSPYFGKDIVVSVVEMAGYSMGAKNCGLGEEINVIGCTYSWEDRMVYSEVENGDNFERALVHEATHYQTGFTDEKLVDAISNSLINWVK